MLEYIAEKHTKKETSEVFKEGTTTIKAWKKLLMDNASRRRKSVLEVIAKFYGYSIIWLPPYSPDENRIETFGPTQSFGFNITPTITILCTRLLWSIFRISYIDYFLE